MKENDDGDDYSPTISGNVDEAPITHAMVMRFQMMSSEIASAAPERRTEVALNEMYAFLGNLVTVVHQLETGRAPDILNPPSF